MCLKQHGWVAAIIGSFRHSAQRLFVKRLTTGAYVIDRCLAADMDEGITTIAKLVYEPGNFLDLYRRRLYSHKQPNVEIY
jgi:hypothetical protein